MEPIYYLDNSATTKPCAAAIQAATQAMTVHFGNPSSLYRLGLAAENVITDARMAVAKHLLAREDEIVFTSCGSESNNTAIFGAAMLRRRVGRHVVTTAVEHPSVLECMKQLENNGYEVTYLKPDKCGNISAEQFAHAVRKDTVLVSCMAVNNETGARFPVQQLRAILEDSGSRALLHLDYVQAFGKLLLNVGELRADFISVSAHKIHGLKGCGALYIKKGLRLPPYIHGGGQEKGLRSGTEAVPNIAAFGAAVQALPEQKSAWEKTEGLRNFAIDRLKQFDNVVINSPADGCPYILNFSFLGYRSETLLHALAQQGVYVSSGSACSKGKGSYVLREMGLEPKRVDSALRISFSYTSSQADIVALCQALEQARALVHR